MQKKTTTIASRVGKTKRVDGLAAEPKDADAGDGFKSASTSIATNAARTTVERLGDRHDRLEADRTGPVGLPAIERRRRAAHTDSPASVRCAAGYHASPDIISRHALAELGAGGVGQLLVDEHADHLRQR